MHRRERSLGHVAYTSPSQQQQEQQEQQQQQRQQLQDQRQTLKPRPASNKYDGHPQSRQHHLVNSAEYSKSADYLPIRENPNAKTSTRTWGPQITPQPPRNRQDSQPPSFTQKDLPTPPPSDRGTPHLYSQVPGQSRASTPISIDGVLSYTSSIRGHRKETSSSSLRNNIRLEMEKGPNATSKMEKEHTPPSTRSSSDASEQPRKADGGETPTRKQRGNSWLDDGVSTFNSIHSSISGDDIDYSDLDGYEMGLSNEEMEEARISNTLFRLRRKELEGSGIATGESTMLGSGPDIELILRERDGARTPKATMRPPAPTSTSMAENPSSTSPTESQTSPRDSMPPTALSAPPPPPPSSKKPSPSQTRSSASSANAPPSAPFMRGEQIKRKPSPAPASFAQRAVAQQREPPQQQQQRQQQQQESPPQDAHPQPLVPPINTNPPLPPPDVLSNANPNNLRSPFSAASVNSSHWGTFSPMQVSVVELPPPPRQYPALPAGAEKKMLEGDWEDTNDVDGGEVPPPPYVARLSMYGGAPTDEKAALRPRPRRNESEDGQPIIEESEANRGEDEDKDEDGEDIYRSRPRRRRSSTPRRIVPPNELDRQLAGRGSDDEDEEEEREEKIVATVSDLEADPGTGTFGPTGSSRPDHGNNNSRALYVARRSTTVKRGPGTKRPSSMSGPPVSRTSTLGKHSRNRLSQSHQAPEVNESNLPPLDRSIFRDAEDSDLRSLYLKHLQQERRLFAEYQKIIAIEQKIWEEERKRSNEIIQKLQAKVKNLLEKGSQNPEEGTFGQGMDYHRMRAYQQELQNQHHRNNGKQRAIEGYPDSHLHQHQHPHMHNHNLNHTFSPVSATTPIDHTTWEVGTMGAYRPRGQVSSYMSHNPQDYNSYSSSTSGGTLNSAFNPPQSATSSTSGFSFSSSAAPNNSSQRQYWADFLDDNRLSSRCATIPQIGASSSSNGLQHHQHHPLLYGERGGGDGADGLGLGKEAVVREDEEMRTRQPIKEERAVYARMYAEASIGIGGPSSELL